MPIEYQNILGGVLLRAMQLGDGDAAQREALYNVVNRAASADGVEIPVTALKEDILATEIDLAMLIGNSSNPTLRAHLLADSDFLLSGEDIPTDDDVGVPFVGVFDGVFDADTGRLLTEQDETVVMRRIDNPGSFWKVGKHYYCYRGTKIYHTRIGGRIFFRGCSFDRHVAEVEYNSQRSSVLPMEMETTWIDKVLERASQENWLTDVANRYGGLAKEKIPMFLGGNQ